MKLPIVPGTARKDYPLYSGLLKYFPDALAYVSYVSKVANDQHNPGEELHWAKEKSADHEDCLLRHLLNVDGVDEDGVLEAGKVAWRALALLQVRLEKGSFSSETSASTTSPPILYPWEDAPRWAKWAASGADGEAFFFENRPVYNKWAGVWVYQGGRLPVEIHMPSPLIIASQDSLEARPTPP